MKGDKTKKILEIISEGLITTNDIILTILESGYGSSYSKLSRNLSKRESARIDIRKQQEEKQRFYSLLSKLKSEGFISSKIGKWSITKKGTAKINDSESKNLILKLPSYRYQKEKDNKTKIVIFDIPEKDKKKRGWLRLVLLNLDYSLLQKSVWIGKTKIPEEFLNDIQSLKLMKHVHIFTVEKSGSINL